MYQHSAVRAGATVEVPRGDGPLVDGAARAIRYVRISVTDRCNFRCRYCMPMDAGEMLAFAGRGDLLTFEEIASVVETFAQLGVRKVRLTGGEPLVRARIETLIAMLAPTVPQVVMTTNGHLLAAKAARLAGAGLASVNVSLDTLDPVAFGELTGGGDLGAVVAGIDAALAAGLGVKLNAVLDGPARLGDAEALCEFAWRRGLTMRFIEKMPLSEGSFMRTAPFVRASEVIARVAGRFGRLVPCGVGGDDGGGAGGGGDDAGPARYWEIDGDPARRLGVISAISDHFCDTCNRVRVTATGALHTCLGYDDAVDLRGILRGTAPQMLPAVIRAAVQQKRHGHVFDASGGGGPTKHMISVGG